MMATTATRVRPLVPRAIVSAARLSHPGRARSLTNRSRRSSGNVEVYSDSDYEDPIYGEGCFCSEGRPKLDGRTWNRIVREGYRGQMGTTFDDSCMDGRTCAVVYYQYTCCKNTCESYRDGFEDPVRYPTDEGCCGDVCKSGQSGFGSQGGNCLSTPLCAAPLLQSASVRMRE